jgi:hypothetical protein
MGGEAAVITVYDPPRAGLPYLAVVVYPDGEVSGIAAETAAAAQHLVEELAAKIGLK